MIKVDENEPIGELEAKFPYRDVRIKRGVDVKEFYDLEAEIGRGKFGTVYLCREKATNLPLAAKFVGIQRRQDRKNVEREVEIMRTLQHPRLIQLYDAFESNNTMVVVLELIEGGELFERVIGDDFILTEKACTIFMRQICEGVAFIHKNNIIHLDLKPENILCLTKTGNRIKIIDFGLARHYEAGNKLQVLFGTPEFVAPEVVNFEQISPATDMWSVGVICYVLLSGLSPFMGDTDVETMSNVTLGRYDFDDDSFDNISANAKDFIYNLLLKDKEARLTAEMCLQHPWLRKKTPPPPPTLVTAKENLKVFVDNYQNANAMINREVEQLISPKPPALSAVELITASDKKFLNRDLAKSFSNIGNDNVIPPVRLHDLLTTNNNVTPVVNDSEVEGSYVPSTNDQVLNIVNANMSSMPTPPSLDSTPTISPNVPFVPDSLLSLNTIKDNQGLENNKALIDEKMPYNTKEGIKEPIASLPALEIPIRMRPVQEIPVAPLPFISKSLPAAAAMIDENMVDQLKPLHIPLIPSLPFPQASDEQLIAHPLVESGFPVKMGLPLTECVPQENSFVDVANYARKRGSIDVLSLITKRGSIDVGLFPRRGSQEAIHPTSPCPPISSFPHAITKETPTICQAVQEPEQPTICQLVKESERLTISQPVKEQESSTICQSVNETVHPIISQFVKDPEHASELTFPEMSSANEGILETSVQPKLEATEVLPFPALPLAQPAPSVTLPLFTQERDISSLVPVPKSQDIVEASSPAVDTFIPSPEPPVFVPSLPPQLPTASASAIETLATDATARHVPTTQVDTSIPIKPYSPVPELLRTSPIVLTTSRRESPLQKTLDDIPKLSSEILSSFTKIPSLSRSTSYETSLSKSSFETRRTVNYSESSKFTYERGRSPRTTVLSEQSTNTDISGTVPKGHGVTMGKRSLDEKSAFTSVVSRRSTSTTSKWSDTKETEATQHLSKVDTDSKNRTESDALGFKQRLRSTAPWFSERKTESERSIEKRSSDMSDLLNETLGPLGRSPWAREIRKISAKLVEMSKEQTARKQQEESHAAEMNEKTARRQKFKVSVLNRDVVFGAAREFYVGGEVPLVNSSPKDQTKPAPQSSQYSASQSSPKRKITPTYSSKTK